MGSLVLPEIYDHHIYIEYHHSRYGVITFINQLNR